MEPRSKAPREVSARWCREEARASFNSGGPPPCSSGSSGWRRCGVRSRRARRTSRARGPPTCARCCPLPAKGGEEPQLPRDGVPGGRSGAPGAGQGQPLLAFRTSARLALWAELLTKRQDTFTEEESAAETIRR